MLIRIGMEEDPGKQFTAWALDFPACFAYGKDEAEALLNLPRSLLNFDYWVRLHSDTPWFSLDNLDLHVDEIFKVCTIHQKNETYEVNAFFQDDLRPISQAEIENALTVLKWQQEELLAGLEFVPEDKLNEIQAGQRWSILGIVRHLATSETWYLQNLNLQPKPVQKESTAFQAIQQSYQEIREILPTLAEDDRLTEVSQEKWTTRKLIRRVLWHRRDHIDHIRQLLGII